MSSSFLSRPAPPAGASGSTPAVTFLYILVCSKSPLALPLHLCDPFAFVGDPQSALSIWSQYAAAATPYACSRVSMPPSVAL
eukprot:3664719-Pleurochrysis_carterae.AAC.2